MQGARTLENIFFDVDQLSRLSRTEQAQHLVEVARQIDDRQRAAANDPASFLRELISSDKI